MLKRALWDGLEVAAIGFGGWAIGGPFFAGTVPLGWGQVDDRESTSAIHAALDRGIRFFDTASNYGGGHSEAVLGAALEGRRDVVIATKFGHVVDPETKQALQDNVSPDFVRQIVERSLRNLRREHIDLLQLHLGGLSIDEARPVFEQLAVLREAGTIGAFGWSTDDPERAAAFAGLDGFVSIQHAMNVLDPADAMIAVIERAGLVSINRGPLAMGLLTGKFAPTTRIAADDVRAADLEWMTYFKDGRVSPEFTARLDSIRALLRQGGRSLTQGALAWLLARSSRTLPIPGIRTVKQAEENAGALDFGPLPADTMAEIDRLLGRSPAAATAAAD